MESILSPQNYLTLGAGGLSFLILAGIVVYFIRSLNPTLVELKTQSTNASRIIENNTAAIRELSKSNENVAHALELLNVTYKEMKESIDYHTKQSDIMHAEIIKIGERVNLLSKKGV